MEVPNIAKINYENITRDEAFVQFGWLISGLTAYGAFSGTLDLFGSYSLSTPFTTILGATVTNAHVVGAVAVAYAIWRGGVSRERFMQWDTGKQLLLFFGLGLFFVTGWNTGLEQFIVSNDLYVLIALAIQNAAFVEINVLDSEDS